MSHIEQYGLRDYHTVEMEGYPESKIARVTAQYKGAYKVVTQAGTHLAELTGKFIYDTKTQTDYPTVGDFVLVNSAEADEKLMINKVLRRKSIFIRRAVGVSGQAQAVAANIDYVFLCMSLNKNYSLNRLERYLSIAWDSGATPVILLTKSDLSEDVDTAVAEAERVSGFCDVLALSVYDEDAVTRLSKYLAEGKTAAFIGSSGVGKSTLINKILGTDALETQSTDKADKGRHTTTGRELYFCEGGGMLIDTPGMRELGADTADVEKTFGDIELLAENCRFSNCSHSVEHGCAVREAIENGSLDERRLNSYFKLKNEITYDGLSSKERENKKLERMFKEVGGIKGARKHIRENAKNKNR